MTDLARFIYLYSYYASNQNAATQIYLAAMNYWHKLGKEDKAYANKWLGVWFK